jgi:hypothetical protein
MEITMNMHFDLETTPAAATIRSKLAGALLACVGASLAATIAASAAGLVVVTTMLRTSPADSVAAQPVSAQGACALPFHAGAQRG